jgi:hypothetical protein
MFTYAKAMLFGTEQDSCSVSASNCTDERTAPLAKCDIGSFANDRRGNFIIVIATYVVSRKAASEMIEFSLFPRTSKMLIKVGLPLPQGMLNSPTFSLKTDSASKSSLPARKM